jgi:N-dimethylarginine dimethylaminohydrolase
MSRISVASRPRIDPGLLVDAEAALHARPVLAVGALQCTNHHPADRCRYQVAWSINPHMSIGSVDFAQAAVEHEAFVATLAASGATVLQLPFVHGAYDSVFVKDAALLLSSRGRRRALLARFRNVERQQERTARAVFYANEGYEVVNDEHSPRWEGGDVVMLPSRDGLFLGHGYRSEYGALAWLERHAGIPVWPLELIDPHLYHLDMVLTFLPDGTALACVSAMTPRSVRALEQVAGVRRLIAVSRESALRFSLNMVFVNNTVVLGAHDPHIETMLEALGYRCVVVPLTQFHLAGGSAACLVAAVHRGPFD